MLIKGFKGYTSKPDEIHDDPAMASSMKNCIINKGDICNHPYAIKQAQVGLTKNSLFGILETWTDFIDNQVFEGRNYEWFTYEVFRNGTVTFRYKSYFDNYDVVGIALPDLMIGIWIGSYDPETLFPRAHVKKSGTWLYISPPKLTELVTVFSRSFKVKVGGFHPTDLKPTNLKAMTVGIRPPAGIVFKSLVSGGAYDGTYDFAISFMKTATPKDVDVGDQTQLQPWDSVESNVIKVDDEKVYANQNPVLKIYLPWGHTGLEPVLAEQVIERDTIYAAVYSKKSTQSIYFFVGYYALETPEVEVSGNFAEFFYTQVTVTNSIQNSARVAAHSGRSCPLGRSRWISYWDRIYSNTEETNYQSRLAANVVPFNVNVNGNRIQVSPTGDMLARENGRFVSNPEAAKDIALDQIVDYVDDNESFDLGLVNTKTTGFVEYLGQLIIFQEKKTFVMTAPISAGGELRTLWDDRGCISTDGNETAIVLDNVVYFLSSDGVRAWAGGLHSDLISEAISEDLESLTDDEYRQCRFLHDERYHLLYISFPTAKRCFVFHYREGGAWSELTNRGVVQLFKSPDKQVFMQLTALSAGASPLLVQLGLLTDRSVFIDPATPNTFDAFWDWEWESVRWLNSTRGKQYKELTILTSMRIDLSPFEPNLALQNIPSYFTCDFTGEDWTSGTTGVTKQVSTFTKRIHIGWYVQNLKLKISGSDFTYMNTQPFRINGFTLTTQQRGRR